jgi:hypothetical protein
LTLRFVACWERTSNPLHQHLLTQDNLRESLNLLHGKNDTSEVGIASQGTMPAQFQTFEATVRKRRRSWRWYICTAEGNVVMMGSDPSRPGARYQANRALFMLLLNSPYRASKGIAPDGSDLDRFGEASSK